jgi:alpha-1,2-mannosyltransferase
MESLLVSLMSNPHNTLDADSLKGFHATTAAEYATGFEKALSLSREETLAMRLRARKSAERFTDAGFAEKWLVNMEKLVSLQIARTNK